MTTTCSDLIERTRRHLYTETRDERSRLSAAVNSSETTFAFAGDMGGIQSGAVLSCGLEEMHVWSVSASTAVVERGINGSTAAAHASGDSVFVNPKFSGFSIFQALNEDLLDLSSPDNGLFRVRTVDIVYDGNTSTYDLAGVTDLVDIIDVTYDANDGTALWATIPRSQWRLKRSLPTATFASGMVFELKGYAMPGSAMNISYKSGFSPLTALTDAVTTVTGLASTMVDIPPLGAAVRLTAGAEVGRNFLDQGETRRAGEVPAGARNASMRTLLMVRQNRINAEASRLYSQYPVTKS